MPDKPKIPIHGGEVFRIARELGLKPSDLVDMSASINPLGIPDSVKNAIYSAVNDLTAYPDSDCTLLVKALSTHLGVPEERILPANGSTELISLLPRLVGKNGRKKALIIAPSFSEYERSLILDGWDILYHILSPDDRFELRVDLLEKTVDESFGLIIVANPGNPSGKAYERAEIAQIAEIAAAKGAFTLIDEAFIDFVPEKSLTGEIGSLENVIILRSMTKFYAVPGIRLGYAAASPAIISELNGIKERWSVNTLAQAAGIAALADNVFRLKSLEYIKSLRCTLLNELSKIEGVEVAGGDVNYLLLKIAAQIDSSDLYENLLKNRIIVRRCGNFRGLDDRFFRIAVKTESENHRFTEALSDALAICHSPSDSARESSH